MTKESPYSQIMIFGIPGSGKSTFAIELGNKLALPVIHLDKYFFIKNWQERDYAEFLQMQRSFVEQNGWIIDGNATKSLEMRFSRANIVLYFRFNRLLCLWRICKRLLFKHPAIMDRADGCSEKIRLRLVSYLWTFDKRVRHKVKALREIYPEVIFHEIKNKNDLALARDLLLNRGSNAL